MAKKAVARTKMPLEWAMQRVIAGTSGTSNNGEIDLDLLQDEVAEIHKIDSYLYFPTGTVPNADEVEAAFGVLSLDPNIAVALDPFDLDQVLNDLETFFHHAMHRTEEAIGSPSAEYQAGIKAADHVISDFNVKPVLVGTNIGMLCRFSSTTEDDLYWDVRVYFTRRKASVQELNQILLKRR